jgi:V-type H+-transporting ATPase subunit C
MHSCLLCFLYIELLQPLSGRMSNSVKYLLVSLPTSICSSNDQEEALAALRTTISKDYGTVYPFRIPEFKIGTLDALVQQADELAKLDSACEGVVSKVADSLRNILDGDEGRISQQKTVNDSRCRFLETAAC